ncbi:MAG: hypothetical protein HUU48_03675 [Flavobacteriales bacterium]|nr:hypothetical protein [Flavobacteriales bacterium]
MFRCCIWSILFWVSFSNLFAQDTIVFNKNIIEEVKILEIGTKTIKYKKTSFLDGPDYIVSKIDVRKIILSNGDVEEYTPMDFYGTKNRISFVVTSLLSARYTIMYERLLLNGKLGVQIPLVLSAESYRMAYDFVDNYVDYEHIFASGVNLNFYPQGQKKVSYYLGGTFRSGLVEGYERGNYDWWGGNTRVNRTFYGAYFTNGVLINTGKYFAFSSYFSVGAREVIGEGPAVVNGLFGVVLNVKF